MTFINLAGWTLGCCCLQYPCKCQKGNGYAGFCLLY